MKKNDQSQFEQIIKNIQTNVHSHNKHNQIRIKSWVKKLKSISGNPVWLKNRDNYARILQFIVQEGYLISPFSNMPPDNIPKLPNHQISKIYAEIDRIEKNNQNKNSNHSDKEQNKIIQTISKEKYSEASFFPLQQLSYSSNNLKVNDSKEISYFKHNRGKSYCNNIQNSRGCQLLKQCQLFLSKFDRQFTGDRQYLSIMDSIRNFSQMNKIVPLCNIQSNKQNFELFNL